MDKINFVNGTAPALNATNLNQMQINIENAILAMKTEALQIAFPIGQTYITQTDVNPSTILNFGTWERVKGKVLVGLDENDTAFNTIGKTGGEKTHTLTVDEMPSHSHTANTIYPFTSGGNLTGIPNSDALSHYGTTADTINKTGGSQPHNNLQPYQVIGYMWIRTA